MAEYLEIGGIYKRADFFINYFKRHDVNNAV